MKKQLSFIVLTLVLGFTCPAFAQTSITGTTCATSGTQYTYTIAGNWSGSTTMTWSITGSGTFSGSSSGTPCPQVHVTWTGSGTLSVTTSNPSGSASVNVSISSNVTGGTVSPSSQTINYGGTPTAITCTVATGGSCTPSYSYQWQSSVDDVNFSNISGATGQNYSSGSLTQTTYFRRYVDETVSGTTAYSTVATVTVNPQLSGGTIGPASQQIFTGGTVTGLNGTGASGGACTNYTYQWQSSTDGVNYSNIGGATSTSYTPPATAGLVYYRRVVSCSDAQGGETGYSTVCTVDIQNHLATGTLSPASVTINPGASPGTFTGTASTGGFCSSYTYSWYSSPDGSTWTAISGATGQSYTAGNLSVNTYYERETVCGSESVYSNTAEAIVQTQSGSISPATQQINYDANASALTVSGMAGGTGTYSYQWQSSPNSSFSSPTNVGTGASTFTPTALTSTTYYRVQVSSGGTSAYTASVVVNVYPQLVSGSISASSQTINYNTTPSGLTLSGVSGGNGSYSYQWQSSPNSSFSSPTNVGTSSTSYQPPALTATTYYRVAVTSNGITGYSATAVVTVYAQLGAGSISPSGQTINYNTTPATMTVSGVTGGSGSYTYQWYSNASGSYQSVSGATGTSYSPAALTSTTSYYAAVTSNAVTVNTATVTITVYPQLVAGSISASSQTINYNVTPSGLTLSGVSGGNGSYSYQWQSSPSSSFSSPTSVGTNSTSYQPPALTATTYYRVAVTSNGVTAYSATAVVNVYAKLVAGSISPSSQTINYNTTAATMTVSGVSGGSGSYTYVWYSNASGSYQPISGATSTSYSPGAMTSTTSYYVAVTSNGVTVNTATVTVTVYPKLVAGTISPSSQTINYNTVPATMTESGVAGGTGTYTYQWYSNATGSYQTISGATAASYTPGALTATTGFEVVVSSNGVNVTSGPVTVTVLPAPLVPGVVTPGTISVAAGTSPGTFTCTNATGGSCGGSYNYQWESSTDEVKWTSISGATALTYNPGNLSSAIFYRLMVTCSGVTTYSNDGEVSIRSATADMNYIQLREVRVPGTTNPVTAGGLSNPTDVAQTTQYFDGLGRPVQTVAKQASPLQFDMVTVQAYDGFNREVDKYLPYTSGSTDGIYKTTALTDQNTFNSAQFPNEQYYYGQTSFEASPLNRPLAVYAPGINMIGASRGVSTQYLINGTADSVHIWNIDTAAGSIPVDGGKYGAGQLSETLSTDEQNHQMVEYKDNTGHVVLKKVMLANTPGTAHVGWLCTYYVYDDLNNLRFVIPPRAVEVINTGSTWSIPQAVASEFCFRYAYDYRNRMIIKKVPGAGEVWMVYDARDRVVMSQDSLQRKQQKWQFVRYDVLNRQDSMGLITDPTNYNNRAYHQNLAAGSTSYPNLSLYTTEVMTAAFYDGYTGISAAASLPSTMATNYTGNGSYFITSYGSSPIYAVQPAEYPLTRGLVTGNMVKVIGTTNQYEATESFYDDNGRVIQVQSINSTGGADTLTIQYNFSGKPLRALQGQAKLTNTAQYHQVLTKYGYDAGFRVTHIDKNIDGAASDQLIDSLRYNEEGDLAAKYLGNDLDSLDYSYNIQGWLTGINLNFLAGTATNYFGMELGYDKTASVSGATYANPQYNGNVAGTVWKTAGDGVDRKYDASYDNVNRLAAAAYTDNKNGAWNTSAMDFSVSNITYDANGNILTMNQKGFMIGNPGATIDQLTYTYSVNGSAYTNKLSQVNDAANNVDSLLGDFHYKGTKGAYDYTYDGNGNLTKDNNKNIDTIYYNYLGLPQQVHMKGEGNVFYTYDGIGTKIKKQVIDSVSGLATTTLYLDGFQYQRRTPISSPTTGTDTLQFAIHEEGRARWAFHKYLNGDSAYAWEYDFAEKDHEGNTRVMLTQEKDTSQYLATMEAKYRATENALFYNIDSTSYARASVSGYPDDLSITNPNDSVARVNGNGHKVGPAIILKVMAGDKVDLGVQYYYNSMSNTNGPDLNPSDLLNSLASGLASLSAPAHGALAVLDNSSSSPLLAALSSSIGNETGAGTSKPQAYLNWVLLDDQFNYVGGSNQSGALQVVGSGTQSNGQLQPALAYSGLPITKSGYLYVYVSNATPGWDVFFDNLSVKQYSGPMLEENHYYPFGLTMAGISDKAIKSKYAENKYRYGEKELNNEEFSDGSQLEVYDYNARTYDPQIGRFQAMDLLAGKHNQWSTYSYSLNSPMRYTDPTGMDNDDAASGMAQTGNENDDDPEVRVKYLYDTKTQQIVIQQVSEDEYQKATNGGTTDVVQLIFSYANNTGSLVTPHWHGLVYNDNLPETGTGETYQLTDMHFERPAGEPAPEGGGDEAPSSYEMLHHFIHWTEFGFTAGEVSNASNLLGKFGPQRYKYWVGNNMQVIFEDAHPRFFGNQFTGSRKLMTEFAEGMEKVARPLGVVSAGMSLVQAGVDVYNGHYKAAGVHALDAAMGLIGTFGGPVGWAVSGAYFISRFWWGNKEDE